LAPSLAKATAEARPMPLVPPVIRTTLFANVFMKVLLRGKGWLEIIVVLRKIEEHQLRVLVGLDRQGRLVSDAGLVAASQLLPFSSTSPLMTKK